MGDAPTSYARRRLKTATNRSPAVPVPSFALTGSSSEYHGHISSVGILCLYLRRRVRAVRKFETIYSCYFAG